MTLNLYWVNGKFYSTYKEIYEDYGATNDYTYQSQIRKALTYPNRSRYFDDKSGNRIPVLGGRVTVKLNESDVKIISYEFDESGNTIPEIKLNGPVERKSGPKGPRGPYRKRTNMKGEE